MIAIALLAVLGGRPARATPAIADPNVFHFDPYLDTSLLVGGFTIWATAYFVVSPTNINNVCDPCNPEGMNALDRAAIGLHNEAARLPSYLAYAAPMVGFALLDATDVGWRNYRTWLTDFVVIFESMAIQGALTEVFRRAVLRPRPFMYEVGVYPDERGKGEAVFSFWSGHVSAAFDMMTALAFTWTLRHPHSPWRWAVWTGSLLVASVFPVLRVISGDHFPTDVITGAVIGTALGVGWPALRWRLAQRQSPVQLTPAATPTAGGAVISLRGAW